MLFSIHIFRYYGAVQCLERNKDPCQIYSNTCVLKFVSEPSALCLEDWRSEICSKEYINDALLPFVGQIRGGDGEITHMKVTCMLKGKRTPSGCNLTPKGDGTKRKATKILIVL